MAPPIASPVVSGEELAFACQASPAGQHRKKRSDNPEDLGKEGPGRQLLHPYQLSLHNEESHQFMSTLTAYQYGTTSVPENPFVGSVYWDGKHRPTFIQFKTQNGFDEAFPALHGTHASRYTRAIEKARRPTEKVKQLCRAVPMNGNERRESLDAGHRFVAAGLQEIERHEVFRDTPRPDPTTVVFQSPYFVEGKEIKAYFIMLEDTPFMGYGPGTYLLRVQRGQPPITEGVVPFTTEENVHRLVDEVLPAIKDMVLAFIEFDPRDINRISQWCKKLRRKNVLEFTTEDVDGIHDKWKHKFMGSQTPPSILELQLSGSDSKFSEAAWLLEEVERSGAVYPWSDGFKQLLQDATGQCVDDLRRRYISDILHREALCCIRADRFDRVLAYEIPEWAFVPDIFDLHEPNCRALVNDFAPTPQRLAEIRNVAEKLLHQYLPADKVADILREHNSPIGTQDSAQHSSNFDDNIYEEYIASSTTLQQPASPGSKAPPATNNKRKRTRITPQTSSALPASQSASQSASPWASPWASPSTSPSTSSSIPDPPLPLEETAPVKRGRGRPKKKEGDPKGPYTRRKPVSERAPNKRQKRGEDSN